MALAGKIMSTYDAGLVFLDLFREAREQFLDLRTIVSNFPQMSSSILTRTSFPGVGVMIATTCTSDIVARVGSISPLFSFLRLIMKLLKDSNLHREGTRVIEQRNFQALIIYKHRQEPIPCS